MQENRIRYVCFDLGGVVVRICRSFAQGCAQAGLAPPARLDFAEFAAVARRYESGLIDTATFVEQARVAVEGEYTAAQVMAVHHGWLLDPYEGVAELVLEAHAAGFDTALLSNTNEAHWPTLSALPAVGRIRHHFPSHLTGRLKPNADAYVLVEERLSAAGPEIVFFDDTAINVDAARQRGWNAFLVDPEKPTAPQMRSLLASLGLLRSGFGTA